MSIAYLQQRGVAWDIIAEAIDAYDRWMLDDDYDATSKLRDIIETMRRRRARYADRDPQVSDERP